MASHAICDGDVLIVVDLQYDFCPGGALGDEVVPIVNRLAGNFRNVVLTQDWHPAGHLSFASAHPGRAPYDTIAMPCGPQVLCVQGTPGAAFHAGLHIAHAALVIRKALTEPSILFRALRERPHNTNWTDRLPATARHQASSTCPNQICAQLR